MMLQSDFYFHLFLKKSSTSFIYAFIITLAVKNNNDWRIYKTILPHLNGEDGKRENSLIIRLLQHVSSTIF